MIRLRMLTMSEKPISSRREARRETVGDVVTVCNDPLRCGDLDLSETVKRIIAWRINEWLTSAFLKDQNESVICRRCVKNARCCGIRSVPNRGSVGATGPQKNPKKCRLAPSSAT